MTKPIQIKNIPSYYDTTRVDGHRLVLEKTKNLLPEDKNLGKLLFSIEKRDNYQCNIPELSAEDNARSTRVFLADLEDEFTLPYAVAGCPVYHHNWNASAPPYEYTMFWVLLSDDYLLQIVGLFEPLFSSFYKINMMSLTRHIAIDTQADWQNTSAPDAVFDLEFTAYNVEYLQESITETQREKEKAQFLATHLQWVHPKFWQTLQNELEEKEEATVPKNLFTDWAMYYDLYNPENFLDPDSTVEWEDNSDVFKFDEQGISKTDSLSIGFRRDGSYNNSLHYFLSKKERLEESVLAFFEQYTFGNGGAYANGQHFIWAKIELERLEKTSYTRGQFLKRCLNLSYIGFTQTSNTLFLDFDCAWDTEHGVQVLVDKDFKVEETNF